MSSFSTALFARPTWIGGLARMVDFGGLFDQYNTYDSPAEADARAIANDWAAVGVDLMNAMDAFAAANS